MAHLNFQVLFLLFLLQAAPGCRGIKTVLAHKEGDVVLTCLDSNVTEVKGHRARWIKYGPDEHSKKTIFDWPNKSQGDKLQNDKRVRLEESENGQLCLFLKTLQKSDAGMYGFTVWEGWEIVQDKNISLKVKDCRVLRAVKAAPQTPVRLNCQMNITSGLQIPVKISWALLKGNNSVPVDSGRAEINGTFLAFHSVTTSDSGWYRCTHEQTQRCLEINLHVTESFHEPTTVPVTALPTSQQALTGTESVGVNRKEESSETSVPVVASVITGILILVASAGFFIYRRHKIQRKTQRELTQHAGCLTNPLDVYENLTLPRLQDSENRTNSLYLFQEESLCTFQY